MNLPNIITLIRIAMIPVFAIIYFQEGPLIALPLFVLIFLTDMLDGYLARKRNQVTKLGQILDPFADKLLQVTAIVCLYLTDRVPIWFIVILFAKELIMISMGYRMLHKGSTPIPARWYGKVTTSVIYGAIAAIFVLNPETMGLWINIICGVVVACSIGSFAAYGVSYVKMGKEPKAVE